MTARWPTAIVLTFLPFAWKAVRYAQIDSYVPLIVFLALATAVGAGFAAGGRWCRRAVRLWCLAMILWGAARLLLQVLVLATDLREAHLRSQLTPWFSAISLAYLAAGIWIWRRSGRRDRVVARAAGRTGWHPPPR